MIYFDTAYVAKCYVPDDGHVQVRQLAAEQEGLACCEFGRVELAAALHRWLREDRLSPADYTVLLRQLAQDERHACWTWLPVTPALLSAAAARFARLDKAVFLRAGDALHLACAAEHGFTEIYTSDRRVLEAAPAFGLKGRNVLGD